MAQGPQHLGGALPRRGLGHGRGVHPGGQTGAAVTPDADELRKAALGVSRPAATAVGLPHRLEMTQATGNELLLQVIAVEIGTIKTKNINQHGMQRGREVAPLRNVQQYN